MFDAGTFRGTPDAYGSNDNYHRCRYTFSHQIILLLLTIFFPRSLINYLFQSNTTILKIYTSAENFHLFRVYIRINANFTFYLSAAHKLQFCVNKIIFLFFKLTFYFCKSYLSGFINIIIGIINFKKNVFIKYIKTYK